MARAHDSDATPVTKADEPVAPPTPVRGGAASVSLAELPVAGLTRRRIALLIGALVAAWVILLFAHQVGQASEASARADAMRASNATLEANVISTCRERLSDFKVPRAVYVVEEFPLGTLDKLLKNKLREMADERPPV